MQLKGIPYAPDLSAITGSEPLAIVLAQALYYQVRAGESKWWSRSAEAWRRATGFDRSNLYRYLQTLNRKGYIEVQPDGKNLRYRVRLDKVQEALNALHPNRTPKHLLNGVHTHGRKRILYNAYLFQLAGTVKRALVLAQLCFYARNRNTFALSLHALKRSTGFSMGYIRRALAYLEARGYIGLCEHDGQLLCVVRVRIEPPKPKRKPTTAVAPAKPTTTAPALAEPVALVELEQESPYSVVRTEKGLEVYFGGALIGVARSHAEVVRIQLQHRNLHDPPKPTPAPPPPARPRPRPQATDGLRSIGEILASVIAR